MHDARKRQRQIACLLSLAVVVSKKAKGMRKEKRSSSVDVDLTGRNVFADALLEINRLARCLIRLGQLGGDAPLTA